MGGQAAVYVRISRDRTGEQAGVQRQEHDCRALAQERGWRVLEPVLTDDDVSAYSAARRPAYAQLLTLIREDRVNVVLAWHPDRLYRRVRDLEELIDLAEAHGVEFATVAAGKIDLSTPTGRMNARVGSVLAGYESEHKSERIRRKHLEIAQAGRWQGGGRRPFGYDVDRSRKPATLKVNREEARLLRAAARHVLAGGSLHSLVVDWNARGVRTSNGSRWTISDLRRVLLSPQVAGIRVHGHWVRRNGRRVRELAGEYGGDWPAILTRDQHALLQALLTDPSRRPAERAADAVTRKHALAGLLVCGLCGTKLGGRVQTRRLKSGGEVVRRQYTCSSADGGCSSLGITAPDLERFVIEAALKRLGPEDAREAEVPTPPPLDDETLELLAEMRELEERRTHLAEDYADGRLDGRQVQTATRRLDERVAAIQRRLGSRPRRPSRDYLEHLEEFGAFLDSKESELPRAEAERVNEWLREDVIVKIVVSPARAQGVRFDPARLKITWRAGRSKSRR